MGETNANTQSRKWLVTINNPTEKGWTHDKIKEVLHDFPTLQYWCMGDEIGNEETIHTHIYFVLENGIRRRTLDTKLKGGHFDKPNGTSEQNRDYVFKSGAKFNKDENGNYGYTDSKGKEHKGKHYDNTNEEWGEMPVERQGKRNDISVLYEMIKDGMSDYEIMESNPRYMLCMDKVDKARQTIREVEYREQWRSLEVTYIWGVTGAGKSRSVMEKYGYGNVYRVTNYKNPFDGYNGEDVIIFEEFRSSLRIEDMLKYLDGYPLVLPARYADKVACFTKVYFATNIDIREQYPDIQREYRETWNALLRRIHNIEVFNGESVYRSTTEQYLKDGWFFLKGSPFDEVAKDAV